MDPHSDPLSFPLAQLLGMSVTVAEDGCGHARTHVAPDHLNPNGVVHGAVLFALVDTAMGAAALSVLEDGLRCATTDLHLRFLRPVQDGTLEAEATVQHRSRRTLVLSGIIRNHGQTVATATGSFAILGQLPTDVNVGHRPVGT
jgi:acyl-CoA thioesterase